ncbi:spore coat protein U-like protein [Enterobacillus tribolii]|uniref:Spore coat protein U-like protein n=1 Tax=Enterobacillus tribolii TaxID=1487935 RepID=A0A370R4X2_9GAMM|nr:spore coat U domain-containing protein [Enterobacillus tribolii]RDK97165.1 spore coat protein U-like protein [Enterobacillus tribolii]
MHWLQRYTVILGPTFWLLAQPALAVPSRSFQVSAIIVPGCAIQGATGGVFGQLDFGKYPGTSSAAAPAGFVQTVGLTLSCTPGVTLSMSINGGANYTSVRNLAQSGYSIRIPYHLYTSSNYSAASEILADQPVSLGSSNNNITLPIYALAQLNGFSHSGIYTDTLTVTLSW